MKPSIQQALLLTAMLFLMQVPVWAQEQVPDLSQGVSPTYLFKLLAALALVLAVFFLLTWGLKRVQRLPASGGGIRVISGTGIGGKERLMLVQVGEEQLLLGVTPMSVNLVHKLEKPLPENEGNGHTPFDSVLGKLIKSGGKS